MHLTYAALDWQARAIGAMLQSYSASGERALLLYPAGLEFIAAFFGCLYAGVIAVPLPPPNLAQPQRTLPRLRAIIKRCSTVGGAHHVIDSLQDLRICSRKLPELQTMRWLATDRVASALAQEWRDPAVTEQHPGVAPIHFRLHRGTEGCNGQSREPAPQFGPHSTTPSRSQRTRSP